MIFLSKLPTEDHVFVVYWLEECSVSVAAIKDLNDPCPPALNKPCTVKSGRTIYTVVVIRMGMFLMQTLK